VICIEGACHFDTRDEFLKEAHRVLKPGGSLAMSDMLFPITILSDFGQVPRANLLPSIAEYCARLAAAGFVSIEVTDATDDCLGGFRANLARWPGAERRAGRMNLSRSFAAAVICKLLAAFFGWSCQTYLLVSARKPS
jgi:MPBQ/MSBQ methyltransferase